MAVLKVARFDQNRSFRCSLHIWVVTINHSSSGGQVCVPLSDSRDRQARFCSGCSDRSCVLGDTQAFLVRYFMTPQNDPLGSEPCPFYRCGNWGIFIFPADDEAVG